MPGSRRARLADRQAATLLAAWRTPDACVLATPTGFRVPASDVASPCAVVIDPARPEEPGDHDARLRAAVDACADDGTVVLVACGGVATALRGWAPVQAALAAAGFAVTLTPFDVLGLCSPWRAALGARRDRVLTELDAHLAAPSVRAAVRLVETHLVSRVAPEQAGRVLVVGRRAGTCPPAPSRDALDVAIRPLLHDDAVVRWLAFVDAELLTPSGADVDLVRWIRNVASPDVEPLLRSRRRWWHDDLEAQRLGEAAAHRLAQQAIAALEGDVPATLEYELVATFNEAIGGWLDEDATS